MAGARVYRFNQAAWLAGLFSAFQLSGVMAQTPAAVAAPTVAPIVMPTLAASVPDSNFPRYDQLKPAESFRSEEHTSELQALIGLSYSVFCLKKQKNTTSTYHQQRPICISYF